MAPKRRVHFDEFMLETHGRLRVAREREEGDPIEPVAEEIAAEAKLLCFDEMQVTNPADAMILSRLFARLLADGVKVVTTSNRPPRDLYKDGLNRELFVPFIALLEKRMFVVEVTKKLITSSSANDGELDTSTTTSAPASASSSPAPDRVLTPVCGAAGTAS